MADTSPPNSSSASPQAVERSLQDDDQIARLVFARRAKSDVANYILNDFFQFPSDKATPKRPEYDRTESVVWRKVIQSDAEVHAMGCGQETAARIEGKDKKYLGFRSSTVGIVKSKKTAKGHSFSIFPMPEDGEWHLHVKVEIPQGVSYGPSDRQDIRSLIDQAFDRLVAHECAKA